MSSVSIKDLSLNYGEIEVLRNLNLDIEQGEFLVLLGPSGCGKSTLLNCIAGLLDVSEGQVFINGKNVTWEEPKDRGIGMVFQSYALYPQMSVEKNLSFGLRVAGLPRAEIRSRVDRTAEILQIKPLLKRKPNALSGGQRQRVAIGRALVRDVDIFLFDEPLSNLDAKLRTDLRVELKRLHQRLGNTMIYVTHDQIEALTLADRIAIMKNGLIQQLDTPNSIYNTPLNRFVAGFIGSPSMNFVNGTLQKSSDEWSLDMGEQQLSLKGYTFTQSPSEGQKVELGIRPEHIHIGHSAAGQVVNTELNIEIVEPMGADIVAWSQFGGHTFSLRTDADTVITAGETLSIGFDPVKASVFSCEDGNRM